VEWLKKVNLENIILPNHFTPSDNTRALKFIEEYYKKNPFSRKNYVLVENIKEGKIILKFYKKTKIDEIAKQSKMTYFEVIAIMYKEEKKKEKEKE